MDDRTISLLEEASSEEEANALLVQFNQRNAKTFSFPDLTFPRRQRLWKALHSKLSDDCFARCHVACLETVRILSRDKVGLGDIVTRDMTDLMLQLAGLTPDDHRSSEEAAMSRINSEDDYRVTLEAQKSLCNLIFNCKAAQRMCCNSRCLEGIIMRLKTYRDPEIPYDVKFFDMRMLFLLTALCADVRPKLRNELHGITYLMEVLDLILKTSGEERPDEDDHHRHAPDVEAPHVRAPAGFGNNGDGDGRAPCLRDNEVDLACEVLKILFNLTIHVDKDSLDEEDEAHFLRLATILHDLLVCATQTKEKHDELQSHTVNLLTNMPSVCYEELLTPLSEGAIGGYDNKDLEYDGQNMEVIVGFLEFLDRRIDKPISSLQESLAPILTCLCECARHHRVIRKFLRIRVLPPLRDVYNRPEQGETIRNKLCRLLTSPITDVKNLVADFLFVLCKENASRLIKYTGYGNSAGLLANRGLMRGGADTSGNYSSDSEDSDTEEYSQAKDRINPVLGCYEEQRPDPMAGMSEEQKEYEAIQLVNMMDKLARQGVVQPMQLGEDGRPHPIEHILELQGGENVTTTRYTYHRKGAADSDSD